MSLQQRVEKRLAEKNQNKIWLAAALDVPKQNLNNWFKRDKIPEGYWFSAARLLDCNPEWLATGAVSAPEAAEISQRERVANKISELSTDQKRDLSTMTAEEIAQQITNLDKDQLRAIQTILDGWVTQHPHTD